MSALAYRLLRAEEAPALRQFIVSLYGDSYPSDLFADTGLIGAAIASGQLYCSVAMDAGVIVGHLASFVEYPGDHTADGVAGIVLPDYRGMNVMSSLARPLMSV